MVAGDDRISGIVVLRHKGTELLVENIAVEPALQRQGIGRTLMAFAEARAKELELNAVILYTNKAMTENLRF